MLEGEFDAGQEVYQGGQEVFQLGVWTTQWTTEAIATFSALLGLYALGRLMIGFMRALPSAVLELPAVIQSLRSGGAPRLLRSLNIDYFSFSSRSLSWDEAEAITNKFGYDLFLAGSKGSQFENETRSVLIDKADMRGGRIPRILLAEEIQHGLDKKTGEASHFLRRNPNLSFDQKYNLFHIELFQRILKNAEAGKYSFLTAEDLNGIRGIINFLGGG